jgi:DNA polymerase V
MALSGRAFPSPAAEYLQPILNLQDYVVQHPTSTFFARAGTDMEHEIYANDILVIDRSLKPTIGNLVLIAKDGEFSLIRFAVSTGQITVWGVVTYVLHQL